MTEEGAAPPREQGWWGPILATLALLFLPATPPLALLVPVEQTLLLLAPALAVCAVLGWRAGGRLPLAVLWTVFALWVLWIPGSAGTFALLVRGWSVVLVASFAGVLLYAGEQRFLTRALLAIGVAMAVSVLAILSTGGFAEAGAVIGNEVNGRAELFREAWRTFTAQEQWQELVRESPSAQRVGEQLEQQFTALPSVARMLAPAMLALESLAALALAWAMYHRFGRARLGAPLAPLKDLRFHDAFIWGIIAGLVVLVLPVGEALRLVGINLLVFFGTLYALRGLGVLLWFLAPGRVMLVVWTLLLVMFWSVIGVVALAIGVGDTWLDWRRRPRPKSQRSE
jgi:hypothetical protein